MINARQVTAGTAAVALLTVPAGPCFVMVQNVGTATAYVGPGTVTAANGFPIPTGIGPIAFPGYQPSPAQALTVCSASGSVTVGYLISQPSGGTGL